MENNTFGPQHEILQKLGAAKNILVTVSSNPTIDQLSACLGLTLWLNKAGKHATAVFSGEVPSTLDFLQPAETLERTTDSLRDFIISLDKTKADKLRYKVEDSVVKIFITPYRTSLTAEDLEFSQGDFNVDLVIAIGVLNQADLDQAISSHGRILHDATVSTIAIGDRPSDLGSINWYDAQASSLSELVTELGSSVDRTLLDNQIATALLTGIVAETERFSNYKTTPQTMSVSAQLLAAGADQQLVATQLAPKAEPTPAFTEPALIPESEPEAIPEAPAELAPAQDGDVVASAHDDEVDLEIVHTPAAPAPVETLPEPAFELPAPVLSPEPAAAEPMSAPVTQPEPPVVAPEPVADVAPIVEESEKPVGFDAPAPLMDAAEAPAPEEEAPAVPTEPTEAAPAQRENVIEKAHHTVIQPPSDLELAQATGIVPGEVLEQMAAAEEAAEVAATTNAPLPPITALNAQPVHLDTPGEEVTTDAAGNLQSFVNNSLAFDPANFSAPVPSNQVQTMPTPGMTLPPAPAPAQSPEDPNAPPPVPPPLMPPSFPGNTM